jgi:hypothetical protein
VQGEITDLQNRVTKLENPPATYTSPVEWTSGDLAAHLGAAGSIIYGINVFNTLGQVQTYTIGVNTTVTLNPFGALADFFPNRALASGLPGGAFGGQLTLICASNTTLTYGPTFDIRHGHLVEVRGKAPIPSVLAVTALYGVMGAFFEEYARKGHFDPHAGPTDGNATLVYAYSGAVEAALVIILLCETVFEGAKVATPGGEEELFEAAVTMTAAQLGGKFVTFGSAVGRKLVAAARWIGACLAGAGGASDVAKDLVEPQHQFQVIDGLALTSAQDINLVARQDLTNPDSSTIFINALGHGLDGQLLLNGSQGILLTAGSAGMGMLNQAPEAGIIKLTSGPLGEITLHLDPTPATPQVSLKPGGLEINGGAVPVKISSLSEIELSVGPNSIKLTPAGIQVGGLQIGLQAEVALQLKSMVQQTQTQMHQQQATLEQLA